MVKINKYTPVMDGKPVYVYIRDNSKKGIFHYHINIDELPKPARGSTGTHILSDAKEFAYDLYKKLKANPIPVPPPTVKTISFKAVAERWLIHRKGKSGQERHEYIVRKYLIPFFDGVRKVKDASAITQSLINDYVVWRREYWVKKKAENAANTKITYKRKGKKTIANASWEAEVSDSTLKRESPTLNQIIKFARQEGVIKATTILEKPEFEVCDETRPYFTEEQADKLCRLARERAQIDNRRVKRERRMLLNYIMLLRHTGMRTGELSAVRWRDVDLNVRLINVAGVKKGAKKTGRRCVPLFKQALTQLKKIHQDRVLELGGLSPSEDEHIFVNSDGERIRSFRSSFSQLLKSCDFPPPPEKEGYCLYSFRHTIITTTGKSGMPQTLQTKSFGTSPEMIDKHYDHNSALEALAWMDRLEEANAKAEAKPAPAMAQQPSQTDKKIDTVFDEVFSFDSPNETVFDDVFAYDE